MPCGSDKKVDQDDILYTRRFANTTKLLLLGTGESGKTTIIKQMKILHINGFSNDERKEKIPYIKQNIHESIYDIVFNMDKIDPPVEMKSEAARDAAKFILSLDSKQLDDYTEEYFDKVKIAWADPGVKETFQRSNEYQLIDSAEHFLNRLDEIRKPDYIPTTQDILFCRIMTVNISKIEFEVPVPKKYGGGTAEFWMFDVGGQRGHRKKWFQVFEGIQAILFLIAASDFDQRLREDDTTNRLQEALQLFEHVYSDRFLRDAGLVVFLNKQDLLQKKIEQGRKMEKYFPEYANFSASGSSEYERAKIFMKKKITDIAVPLTVEHVGFIPGHNINEVLPAREVYVHYTVATDTNNIKLVFESVQEIILKKFLQESFGGSF